MNLSQDQVVAIQSGQAIHLFEPQSGTECVLLPAEIYRRVQLAFETNVPFNRDERLALLAESGKRAGWDEPEMDKYDNYDAHRQ